MDKRYGAHFRPIGNQSLLEAQNTMVNPNAKEVKVITARSFANVEIEPNVTTIHAAVAESGQKPEDCTIRIDGKLVTDTSATLEGGETITAFATKTVALAGVKGASAARRYVAQSKS